MNNNEYKKWYLIIAIFAIVSMFFGGSLAYFTWITSTEQQTSITLTIEKEFRCEADGGGDINSEEKYLVPTDCTNTDYAIQRTITVSPTIYGDTSITMDLWLDINELGESLSNSDNFMYSLTTDPDSCTNSVVSEGNFNGKSVGNKIELFTYMEYSTTTTDTYYLYIWLDKAETSSDTMDQEFSLSLNGLCSDAPKPDTYFVYNEEDTTLTLYKNATETSQVNNNLNNYSIITLNNNIEKIEELIIDEKDKVYANIENIVYDANNLPPWSEYKENITKIIIEDTISPISTSHWFSNMTNVEYIDISNLDTSKLTNMSSMFYSTGKNVTDTFEIVGLDDLDVSNVTTMASLFQYSANSATTVNIGNISNWDTSNVTNMGAMFMSFASNCSNLILELSEWNVSNVIYFDHMFHGTGSNSTTIDIGDLSTKNVVKSDGTEYVAWDVSKAETMRYMFTYLGTSTSNTVDIGDLSGWDTSNVTDMGHMFQRTGRTASTFVIGDISSWNVSNVTDMDNMFNATGLNASNWSLDLSNWNVSKVTIYDNFAYRNTDRIISPVWNTTS